MILNENPAQFKLSLRISLLETIGNFILEFPGFWIGNLIALAFLSISKSAVTPPQSNFLN